MKLTKEHLALLNKIIDEIEIYDTLSDTLVKELYDQAIMDRQNDETFTDYFITQIVPNLNNEELFKITWAVMRNYNRYGPIPGDILNALSLLTRDLYYVCANRLNYVPGENETGRMNLLNWYVYQNKFTPDGVSTENKKRAVAIAIKVRLIEPALTTAKISKDESEKIKMLVDKTLNISQEEIDKIINVQVLEKEPPKKFIIDELKDELKNEKDNSASFKVRLGIMRKFLTDAGYVPSITPKQEEKDTKQTYESLKGRAVMQLTQENLALLSRIIDEITINGTLSDELIQDLYARRKLGNDQNKAFERHFKTYIIPNLSNKELFNVTLAVLRGHQQYQSLFDVLSDPNSLSRDLYYIFAKRLNYSASGNDSSQFMDVLNWYVYQNKLGNATDASQDKKKAAAIVIRTRLVPEISAGSETSMDELIKAKALIEQAKNLSPEEIEKIINPRVLGETPPTYKEEELQNDFIATTEARVLVMRKSLTDAGYVPSADLKQEEKSAQKINESLTSGKLKSEQESLLPEGEKKAQQIPKINYAKHINNLVKECVNYQDYFYKTIRNALNELNSLSLHREFVVMMQEAFTVNERLKKANKASYLAVFDALQTLQSTADRIKRSAYNNKNAALLSDTIEKAKALNGLMKNFGSATADHKAILMNFSAEFQLKEKVFKSAHPEDDKFVKKIKLILAVCTLGIAIIPMAIMSGSIRFWETTHERFVRKAKLVGSALEKEQDKEIEKPAGLSLARA